MVIALALTFPWLIHVTRSGCYGRLSKPCPRAFPLTAMPWIYLLEFRT